MIGGLPRSRSQMINVSIVLSTGVHTSLLLLSFCHADLLFLTRTTMRAIQGAGRCFLTLPSGPRKILLILIHTFAREAQGRASWKRQSPSS